MPGPFRLARRVTLAWAALPLPSRGHRALQRDVAAPGEAGDYDRQSGVMSGLGAVLLVAAVTLTGLVRGDVAPAVLVALDAALTAAAGAAWGLAVATQRAADAVRAGRPLPPALGWVCLVLGGAAGAGLSLLLTALLRG